MFWVEIHFQPTGLPVERMISKPSPLLTPPGQHTEIRGQKKEGEC